MPYDHFTSLRMAIYREDRCGNCACWSWMARLPGYSLKGRCLHPIRGQSRGLLGPKDGRNCSDWQRDDPI